MAAYASRESYLLIDELEEALASGDGRDCEKIMQRVADLLWGDSITRDLEAGPHRIRVSNTLVWKTVQFDVRPGQQVFFEAINRPGWGSLPMLVVLGVGPLFVTLRRMDS